GGGSLLRHSHPPLPHTSPRSPTPFPSPTLQDATLSSRGLGFPPHHTERPRRPMARRGRVELRRIEDKASRQVRFSKRRSGLFKKAFELALLCDAEVALLVFSPAGKLFEYSSTSIEDTYDRYRRFAGTGRNVNEGDQNNNDSQHSAASDLQSRLKEIATWSEQNNANESDANELEKLEKLLTNALRDTKSKKMLAKQNNGGDGGSTSSQNRRQD
ncbi:unnamed protein product, partial [Urochloa humidicola]